jgi:hypothetical protein
MTEEMLEVRAALNPDTNEPLYGTCTLSVGDGSVKVQFTNGRAVAPRSVVERYLVENGALEVPALGIFRSRISEGGAVVQSQESVTATGTKALEDMTPEERIEAALRLSELIAADQGGGDARRAEEEPEEPASTDDASPEDPPEETEQERRIREAKEHLEEEGEEVPEVEAEGGARGAVAGGRPAGRPRWLRRPDGGGRAPLPREEGRQVAVQERREGRRAGVPARGARQAVRRLAPTTLAHLLRGAPRPVRAGGAAAPRPCAS